MLMVKRCYMSKKYIVLVLVVCILVFLHFYLIPASNGTYNTECYFKDEDRSNLRYAIQMIGQTLAKHNVTYWLDYGTLLGAVRYKDVLPWDGDADISFLHKDDKPVFHKELYDKYGISSNGLHASYKGQSIDFMRWDIKRGQWDGKDTDLLYKFYPASVLKRENVFILHHHKLETFPASWVNTTKNVNFHGVWLAIPNNPHQFLRHRYSFSYFLGVSVPYKWKCWMPCWLRKARGC